MSQSLQQYKQFLLSLRYPGCNPKEQDEYIQAHLSRIANTFEMLKKAGLQKGTRVLDIGAKPYLLAALVSKFSEAEFVGIGYSIDEILASQHAEAAQTGSQEVKRAMLTLQSGTESFPIEMWQCNIETDALPLPDQSFDFVVNTETLEHLTFDVSRVLFETNRILKPNGKLIFSTPNNLYWVRMTQLMLNRNIDDAYSVHGPYGRHNRNWTSKEIQQLMRANGFRVERIFSTTFLPLNTSMPKRLLIEVMDIAHRLPINFVRDKRGKTLVATLQKDKRIESPVYPHWLYH